MKKKIIVLVPCYNEKKSLNKVIQKLKKFNLNLDILVIDDGSTDDSIMKLDKNIKVLSLKSNLGIGGAMQSGFKYAYSRDYDFCIQIDADGQHIPNQITKLFDKYNETKASIIVGSRYINVPFLKSPSLRRIGSILISKTLRIFFKKINCSDPTSGMRLIDRKAMKLFSLNYPQDFPEPVSLTLANTEGLEIKEVSVKMKPRAYGNSSISGVDSAIYMWKVLSNIFIERFLRTK